MESLSDIFYGPPLTFRRETTTKYYESIKGAKTCELTGAGCLTKRNMSPGGEESSVNLCRIAMEFCLQFRGAQSKLPSRPKCHVLVEK